MKRSSLWYRSGGWGQEGLGHGVRLKGLRFHQAADVAGFTAALKLPTPSLQWEPDLSKGFCLSDSASLTEDQGTGNAALVVITACA